MLKVYKFKYTNSEFRNELLVIIYHIFFFIFSHWNEKGARYVTFLLCVYVCLFVCVCVCVFICVCVCVCTSECS